SQTCCERRLIHQRAAPDVDQASIRLHKRQALGIRDRLCAIRNRSGQYDVIRLPKNFVDFSRTKDSVRTVTALLRMLAHCDYPHAQRLRAFGDGAAYTAQSD